MGDAVTYDQAATPTRAQFGAYDGMFRYFNEKLWGGRLPPCILNFSRKAKTYGFMAPNRWQNAGEKTHEISLNPTYLGTRPAQESVSTLVHEMAHLWQHCFGKPSRTGYHNQQWANEMKRIGLHPSTTGAPGGKEVGQAVSHYIVPGGPFDVAFRAMPDDLLLPWVCGIDESARKKTAAKKNKVKYSCETCSAQAWGKPSLHLRCGDCDAEMTAE